MLNVGRWTLDVGRWTLDVGCSMLDVGCWMFDVRCSMFDVRCSMLDVRCSMFDVDYGCTILPMTGLDLRIASILENDLGVKPGYQHGPKQVAPGGPIEKEGIVLKWYELALKEQPVPDKISLLARSYLSRESLEAKGLGFVILHRCGEDFYFLIVNTWRGNNEVWETVFFKNGDAMPDFAPWPRDELHKPTFCVWELAPVWHEKESWERFLVSPRDDVAAHVWLQDLYAGAA